MKRTLIWFVISAAFIGPGTVTTATSAGASFGPDLLWTVSFAIIACIILQEGAARINIVSNLSLGQALVRQFENDKKVKPIVISVTFAVVLGCAAYEAGNILGAVSGISLTSGINTKIATIGIIAIAGLLLAFNKFQVITNLLAFIIAIMGISLLFLALSLDYDGTAIAKGLLIPRIPAGAELLTLGLIGTTVVPYNLFLGSRLAEFQELSSMRRGLLLSVILGGLITISLILIGSKVTGEFSFQAVANTLAQNTGSWSIYLFAFGLFAAGLTSAITAPWAAALTLQSTLKFKKPIRAFNATWILVLATGLIFGLSEVKPIPIIILAQALNGVLLPFLAIAILFILNNRGIMQNQTNTGISNILLLLIIWITGILGILNILKAIKATFGMSSEIDNYMLMVISAVSLLITIFLGIKVLSKTQSREQH